MYRCTKCGEPWDDSRAQDNDLSCTKRCGGRLELVPPLGLADLRGLDLQRLPYPVALTARRLEEALGASTDVLKTLFLLKDCFEAGIKYLGSLLLVEYLRSPACTTQRNDALLEKLIRPALGMWVNDVIRPLSLWLVTSDQEQEPGRPVAALFAEPPRKARGHPSETELFRACARFVSFRNDTLGHGARQRDEEYEADLRDWLPVARRLLDEIASLAPWRLMLVADVDRCQVWMGPEPGSATEPGAFARAQVGHFVVRGTEGDVRDLFPLVSYLPASDQAQRLHYYDALHRYKAAGKDALVLDYDEGFKQARPEPVAGLEAAFTAQLLAEKFGRHRGRMEVIEGRVGSFGALIDEHAAIVGRRFVIDHVARFLGENDRGLLVIEAEPGKGKTALMAHLVDEIYGHVAPPPAHFFYRRTAGITDPDVCVRSLYHALLEAHGLTEAGESRQQNDPESMYLKLANLLKDQVAPRLTPGRPQLIFIDALDESNPTASGRPAFQRIPEDLPAGVYIIATTRPVTDRVSLARRPSLHWFDLDAPDHLQANLNDGLEYARRELAHSPLTDAAITEVARVAAGNFLVLTLLCRHIRTDLAPGGVPAFLHRLATDGARDRLGFIYEEFWHRITARLPRADLQVLCDVSGVLVAAHGPLTADVITGVLGLRAGDWVFALRHLHEYLTVLRSEEGEAVETFYRIYHESFADFLRDKTAVDRSRHRQCLADYCLAWSRQEGFGKLYALRFGPRHLIEDGRWDDLEALLLDPERGLFFLEAKAEAGLVFDLAMDISRALHSGLPQAHRSRHSLRLIEQALRFDVHFLARHPQCLFQCLWNTAWWYDCPEAGSYYEPPLVQLEPHHGPTLHGLLEAWRARKEASQPGFLWVRSLRPPPARLDSGLLAVLRGHEDCTRRVLFSPDGRLLAAFSSELRNSPAAIAAHIWEATTGREVARIMGTDEGVAGLAFSPDSRLIAVSTRGRGGRVCDAKDGRERVRMEEDEHGYGEVMFSRDGRRVITSRGPGPGAMRIWDAATGRKLEPQFGCSCENAFGRAGDYIHHMSFSPNGRLAAACSSHEIHVWDAEAGGELVQVGAVGQRITAVAFSPDGARVAAGTDSGLVYLWDAETTREVTRLEGHEKEITGLAFSPDGRRMVTGSQDGSVRVWETEAGREPVWAEGLQTFVRSVAFSPDGRRVAAVTGGGNVQVWDAETGRELAGREDWYCRAVRDMTFSSDGHLLVVAYDGDMLNVWDVDTGRIMSRAEVPDRLRWSAIRRVVVSPEGHRVAFDVALDGGFEGVIILDTASSGVAAIGGFERWDSNLAFSPDGRRVAITRSVAGVWDAESGRRLVGMGECERSMTAVAFSPDGRRIATGSDDGSVRVWDATSSLEEDWTVAHQSIFESVAFSPDGRLVAGVSRNVVRVWDAGTGRELAWIEGDFAMGKCLAFSPDGRRLATDAPDGARIWDVETGRELVRVEAPEGRVTGVMFSPDGRRLATGSSVGTVGLWEIETRPIASRLVDHEHKVTCMAFSPDDRLLATGFWDGSARVWDAETGRELARVERHPTRVPQLERLEFAPDGRRITTVWRDGEAWVWDAETGRVLTRVDGQRGDFGCSAISPGGRLIATGSREVVVHTCDVETGRELVRVEGLGAWTTGLAICPDGRLLATYSSTGARVWDVETGRELARVEAPGKVVSPVAFSPDGRLIAACSWDGARVWDVETGRELDRVEAPEGTFDLVAVSLDGRIIVSGSQDGRVSVWRAGNGRELRQAEGQMKEIRCLAVSPDGRLVAAGSSPRRRGSHSSKGTLHVWDVETVRELARVELDSVSSDDVWSVAFSSDGRLLAAGTLDSVRVMVAQEGCELFRAVNFWGPVTGVAFSHDGRLLAAASVDGAVGVGVWEATTGRELARFERPNQRISRVSFTPDGRLRFTGTDDAMRVWDADSGEQLVRMGGHTGELWSAAFSPDGQLLATSTTEGELRVSEAATGRERARMSIKEKMITCVTFSLDGRLVATGSDTGVQVWDISTGREVIRMEGHTSWGRVEYLAFSPDGQRLVSSTYRTIRVWDIGSGACLATHRSSTDPEALARGSVGGPWTVITLPDTAETTISPVAGGDPVAWFPVAFEQLKAQRSGRVWSGVVGNYVYLIRLEGMEN